MTLRGRTLSVRVGSLVLGGNEEVVIQSMTNTRTADTMSTLHQIKALANEGAKLVRVAIPDKSSVESLFSLVREAPVPLVADIHFDYRLALEAIAAGVSKIRINPGNIGSQKNLKQVLQSAKKKGVAIRIGLNTGSVGRVKNRGRYALQLLGEYVDFFEAQSFRQIIISLKSSDITTTIRMNERCAKTYRYPLHLGVTEAGVGQSAVISSAVGIGALLLRGLGSTLRVSIAGSPLSEIPVCKEILRAAGLYHEGVKLIACPTCGRTQVDIEALANEVKIKTAHLREPMTIAVMGCVVNGPGEAQEADFGICGGNNEGLLFVRGKIVRKVAQDKLVENLLLLIDQKIKEGKVCHD